jgi:signal peptidase II
VSAPAGMPRRAGILIGATAAAITCVLDQLSKLWLIFVFDLGRKGFVRIAPGLDLVLTWNPGISYGLFRHNGGLGRWILLAFSLVATVVLSIWLARAGSRLTALALGLIIGGALGNAIDRLAYGAVADFVLFHVTMANWRFDWYVFNLADAAIVAGAIALLYEALFAGRAAKAP